MSPSLPRTFAQLAASAGLTLAIFSLPLWTVGSHAPVDPLTTVADDSTERVVMWTPPAPAPEPEQDTLTDAIVEAPTPEPEPQPEPIDATPVPEPTPVLAAATEVASTPVDDTPPPKKKRRRRRKKRDCTPDVPEIEATGSDRWTVDRDLIDHYARDLKAAERLAYVAWARDDDDRIIGFQVVRVRCGSPLHEAGFRNGDVITKINGHKVRTVPQALAAYVALRIKRKLRVRGHRKDGTPLDHRYRLT